MEKINKTNDVSGGWSSITVHGYNGDISTHIGQKVFFSGAIPYIGQRVIVETGYNLLGIYKNYEYYVGTLDDVYINGDIQSQPKMYDIIVDGKLEEYESSYITLYLWKD